MKDVTFRIVSEKVKIFDTGELCVMLILSEGKYLVEVVNRISSIGRIQIASRKDAEFMVRTIECCFHRYRNIIDAEIAFGKAFSLKDLDKIIFVIYSTNRIITQDDIVYLRKNIEFRTIIKKHHHYLEKQKGAVTIYILPDFSKKPFAYLVGTEYLRDLKFRFL